MCQNSNTTFSSDSNILYNLNTDCDSTEGDDSDLSISDVEDSDDNNIRDQMESDLEEEKIDSDGDHTDIDEDNIDIEVVEADHENIQWPRQATFQPDSSVFEEEFMLKNDIDLPKYPSPSDFFNLLLTQEIIDYIVEQPNLYCTQQNFKPEPMTNLDLYRLVGFLFYSSLCKLPCKFDYWSAAFGPEIVIENITRDRIDQLLRSLHFGDNVLQAQSSNKIQHLIELFNNRCSSIVKQEQNISIDEQMIGFKGRSAPRNYKQYMPKKPKKRGFKLWSLSGVSGFTYRINLYKGVSACKPVSQMKVSRHTTALSTLETRSKHRIDEDNEKSVKQNDDIKRYGQSGMVVIDLLQGVPQGSHIFIDNYFGSLALLHQTNSLGYGLTCTLRSSHIKNCPIKSEKSMKNYPRDYYDYLISKDKKIIIVAWKDNKHVLVGSNFVGIEPVIQLSRWSKQEQQKINIDAPQIVKMYNKNMGGVDKVDMLCALHPIPFRSKKWYMRIAWRILDLMVINAWVLWRHMSSNDKQNWRCNRLFYFKMGIANMMLCEPRTIERRMLKVLATQHQSSDSDDNGNNVNPPKRKKKETASNISSIIRFDGIEHWPQTQRNLCLRCKKEGCEMKMYVYCFKCQIYLCLNLTCNSFRGYHCKK